MILSSFSLVKLLKARKERYRIASTMQPESGRISKSIKRVTPPLPETSFHTHENVTQQCSKEGVFKFHHPPAATIVTTCDIPIKVIQKQSYFPVYYDNIRTKESLMV